MASLNNRISASAMQNHLRLFAPDGSVDVDRTCELAGIDVDRAFVVFGVKRPARAETYPATFVARVRDLAAALEFVAETLGGSRRAVTFWWKSPNPEFGGLAPFDLFTRKRYKPVFQFILEERRKHYRLVLPASGK